MPTSLNCPSCGQALMIDDAAPAEVTCPMCLASVINPAVIAASNAGPLAVIPLEAQATRDSRTAKAGIAALLLLVGFGALLTFVREGARAIFGPSAQVIMLPIVAGIIYVIARVGVSEAVKRRRAAREDTAAKIPPPLPADDAPGVLQYQNRRDAKPRVSILALTGGFFAGLGVCALGMVTLFFTYDPVPKSMHGFVLVGIAAGLITFSVFASTIGKRRPRWRGFGRGATIGLVLGMIALGPCSLCYIAM